MTEMACLWWICNSIMKKYAGARSFRSLVLSGMFLGWSVVALESFGFETHGWPLTLRTSAKQVGALEVPSLVARSKPPSALKSAWC